MTKIKYLTKQVSASASSCTFTDSSITDDCSINIVTSPANIVLSGATQEGNSCIVTFNPGQAFSIRAEVSNIEEFKVDADGDSDDAMPATEEFASDADLEALAEIVDERVPDPATLGAYLYHGTTGNSWNKPDARTLNYDDNSTIYSAMGDIDDLQTEASNLVDAINEISESQGSGASYSTEETKTGKKWFGKDIYSKCFIVTSTITFPTNSWTNIPNSQIDLETIFLCKWIHTNKTVYPIICNYDTNNNCLRLIQTRNVSAIIDINDVICVEYTKAD